MLLCDYAKQERPEFLLRTAKKGPSIAFQVVPEVPEAVERVV
jgi:hypothetical protein